MRFEPLVTYWHYLLSGCALYCMPPFKTVGVTLWHFKACLKKSDSTLEFLESSVFLNTISLFVIQIQFNIKQFNYSMILSMIVYEYLCFFMIVCDFLWFFYYLFYDVLLLFMIVYVFYDFLWFFMIVFWFFYDFFIFFLIFYDFLLFFSEFFLFFIIFVLIFSDFFWLFLIFSDFLWFFMICFWFFMIFCFCFMIFYAAAATVATAGFFLQCYPWVRQRVAWARVPSLPVVL
jgi:hypothetical protein